MILGLAGYARTGKDAVAGFCVEQHGYRRVSFADQVRLVALAVDPLVPTPGTWELGTGERRPTVVRLSELVVRRGWETAKAEAEVRRLLQRVGTEAGRNLLGPDVWVDAAMRLLHPSAGGSNDVVIPDVRFPNEGEAIKARGGQVIRLVRPGHGPVNRHPSETAMDSWRFDAVIENTGSLALLADTTARLVDHLRGLAVVIPFPPQGENHEQAPSA